MNDAAAVLAEMHVWESVRREIISLSHSVLCHLPMLDRVAVPLALGVMGAALLHTLVVFTPLWLVKPSLDLTVPAPGFFAFLVLVLGGRTTRQTLAMVRRVDYELDVLLKQDWCFELGCFTGILFSRPFLVACALTLGSSTLFA
jgi:hypothetical protein